mgnify:CR=1 FL=1
MNCGDRPVKAGAEPAGRKAASFRRAPADQLFDNAGIGKGRGVAQRADLGSERQVAVRSLQRGLCEVHESVPRCVARAARVLGGDGVALAGIITGGISTLGTVLYILFVVGMGAYGAASSTPGQVSPETSFGQQLVDITLPLCRRFHSKFSRANTEFPYVFLSLKRRIL